MAFDMSLEGAEGGRQHKTCFDQDQGRGKRAYAWPHRPAHRVANIRSSSALLFFYYDARDGLKNQLALFAVESVFRQTRVKIQ
jgi:hypothetical protein